MLTLFALPKPFRGHISVIQRNATQSWLRLRPACEVILMGDEEGTAHAAQALGVRHISQVERNPSGTPRVDSLFEQAEKAAKYPYLCYVNADIILLSDFLPAVQQVIARQSRFLLVGRRWDIDLREPLDFSADWEARLRSLVTRRGKLHGHSGIDYFVYPRGLWKQIPSFAIGRLAWDNWLIYQARLEEIPVVDLTRMVKVVHQNHDYSHVPGGEGKFWKSPEAMQNVTLAGGYSYLFTLSDANYRLTRKSIRRKITPYSFYRQLVTSSRSSPSLAKLLNLIRWMRQSFTART